MPISSNLRAALFMVVAMATFTMNDTLTKWVMETMGIGQVILLRGMFASIMIVLIAWNRGALEKPAQIVQMGATVSDIVNAAALAAHDAVR